jgi:hypothetical protein
MISRASLISLAFSVCLFLTGCFRQLVLIDNLPDDMLKGYAAFTASLDPGGCGLHDLFLGVYEVTDGIRTQFGQVTTNPHGEPWVPNLLRVAAKPGPHTYGFENTSIVKSVNRYFKAVKSWPHVVNIEIGRVTPVNILIKCTDTSIEYEGGTATKVYNGVHQFKIGESVPLELWKNREVSRTPTPFSGQKGERIRW